MNRGNIFFVGDDRVVEKYCRRCLRCRCLPSNTQQEALARFWAEERDLRKRRRGTRREWGEWDLSARQRNRNSPSDLLSTARAVSALDSSIGLFLNWDFPISWYLAFSWRNLICRTLSLKCGWQLPQLSTESQRWRGSDRNCQQSSRLFISDFSLPASRFLFLLNPSSCPSQRHCRRCEWLGICSWNSKHRRLLPRRWPFDDRSWPIGVNLSNGVGLSVTRWGVALHMTEERYKVQLYP